MYTTLERIRKVISEEELIRLTDDTGSGAVDTDVVDHAIESAGDEIDAYLGRYSLPLNPVPGILAKLADDLAVFNLYSRHDLPPEHRQKRYDNSIALLKKIDKGELTLGAADPQDGNVDKPEISGSERIFSREKLKGY